jgi:hypothetical protein
MTKLLTEKARKRIATLTSAPIRNLYADYFRKSLNDHRKTCTRKECDESRVVTTFKGEKVYPLIRASSPKEVFLTIDGTPFISIQLASDEATKTFIDAKEGIPCSYNHGHADGAFIHQRCHQDGVGIVVLPNNRVNLVCANKQCGNVVMKLHVAERPTVERPFIFCDYHGKQHGYFICKHVLAGKEPLILNRAGTDDNGFALCGNRCYRLTHKPMSEYKKHEHEFGIVCVGHLNDALGGKLEQYLKRAEVPAA